MFMKKVSLAAAGTAIAALTALSVVPAIAEERTLQVASCFPVGSPPHQPLEALVEAMNERGKGVLQIDMIGGAPAIGSPFTLTQKMSRGAYEAVGCPEHYFGNVVPEANVLHLGEYSYAELRENGAVDYMADLLARKNIHFVGRYHNFGLFHLWLSQPIESPDLTGLHLRVAPVYTAFFESLGATTQQSDISQIYNYMESNTVQGFGWPLTVFSPSWIDVTKYRVDPGFYNSTMFFLVNLDTWESLSPEEQNVITETVMDFERRGEVSEPSHQALVEKLTNEMAGKGIEIIEFTGEDREKWLNASREASWNLIIERSPEHGPKLQALWRKSEN
jgi:TRAP-type C4-dicarboxylate transport system substrate-binding protein